jgi:hypothetical protein
VEVKANVRHYPTNKTQGQCRGVRQRCDGEKAPGSAIGRKRKAQKLTIVE